MGRLVVLDAIRHDYDVVLSMSHVRRVLTVDTATDRPPVIRGMGQLGAADSAPPIRRRQVGAGITRHRRFGAGHFDAILTEKEKH